MPFSSKDVLFSPWEIPTQFAAQWGAQGGSGGKLWWGQLGPVHKDPAADRPGVPCCGQRPVHPPQTRSRHVNSPALVLAVPGEG